MWMNNLRSLMLLALLLDWFGQVLIFVCILAFSSWTGVGASGDSLQAQGPWLVFVLLLYPLLGWLFGSYTVLRWRRLTLPVLLQRLLITAFVTLIVVAIARWLINPSDVVWLVHRRVQFLWIGAHSLWVLFVRFAFVAVYFYLMLPRFCWLSSPGNWTWFLELGGACIIARVCAPWSYQILPTT